MSASVCPNCKGLGSNCVCQSIHLNQSQFLGGAIKASKAVEDEFEAMAKCVEALKYLKSEDRNRVVRYLIDRFSTVVER